MFLIFMIISSILSIPVFIILVYAIIQLFKQRKSNKVYGVRLIGKIKDVNFVKKRHKNDNAVFETHLEIECEYVYEGKTYTSKMNVFNDNRIENYKVGNKIECLYNTKTKKLIDNYNLKFKNNKSFYIPIISFFLLFISILLFELTDSTIFYIITIVLATVFWYSSIYYIFGPSFYKKEKGRYITLKGRVVDYYVIEGSADMTLWNNYYPEITFKYNGEEKKYISSKGYYKKLYNIGQEIDVLYNPEKDIIYGQSSRTLAIIAYAIPPASLLIILIQKLFF